MPPLRPPAYDHRGRSTLGPPQRWHTVQAMCVSGLGLAIALNWVLKITDFFWGESLDFFIYPLAFSAALATLVRHRQRHAAIRTRVRCGICPGCDYPIARLPIETDGCVVCPECGAAWQIADQPDPGEKPAPRGLTPAAPAPDQPSSR